MKKILQRLTLVAASTMSMFAVAGEGEVLVILSSETTMDLADGQSIETGYYLNEFGVPAKALVDAGYELVLATPKGNAPQVDKKSVSTDYFDGDEAKMQSIQRFVASLPDINDTASLSEILAGDLSQYEAVFIPGGHAPLIDLANNPEVGEILRHFNKQGKPTAAICHGPITLLSAQVQPNSYYQAIKDGEKASANNWIYDGYKMTIFSDPEERVFESSLEGKKLKFYPAMAMENAGGNMAFASEWQPNVVVDRELITGQNPFSDKLLAEKLLEMLAK
ncbi:MULTISPECIES: type 1 glutamine amidotransferase domain-containing protein [unclassified Pseudoalteromonas]|uniref:type 1 glutamine amidotransferase domain-containing protein n=1 Tax=unclassified Pseudoalteromonas TaxID=194690 RepID=UPI00110C03E5|nr:MULTISPECIES: type 1 glutamine amidotransferase domain-containing protein [unclassified Pseudoalteromonas]NHH88597.1 Molecular chaperone Hsp31 and glyoxalase 3 [Pseudoalteromonas sp. MB47]TMP42211.1 type 1 glutamine amidotransferase domain-containing protein [Pseudoalteromonas sp. S1650]TMP67354.1 type 1 glutamine amidotransferase domain-containing protein [Pseudoalteromonas sp. S1649]